MGCPALTQFRMEAENTHTHVAAVLPFVPNIRSHITEVKELQSCGLNWSMFCFRPINKFFLPNYSFMNGSLAMLCVFFPPVYLPVP